MILSEKSNNFCLWGGIRTSLSSLPSTSTNRLRKRTLLTRENATSHKKPKIIAVALVHRWAEEGCRNQTGNLKWGSKKAGLVFLLRAKCRVTPFNTRSKTLIQNTRDHYPFESNNLCYDESNFLLCWMILLNFLNKARLRKNKALRCWQMGRGRVRG